MKRAFIDIGTNTVLLLLVDLTLANEYVVLADECHIARLGEGLSKNLSFAPQAKERVVQTLLRYKQICDVHHCQDVLAVGTAAFRKASNGVEFVQEILDATGFQVQIISGEEEARIISKATLTDFQTLPQPLLTLDIGGGSTEFIVTDHELKRQLVSLPFGAVRLHEEFLQDDPPNDDSVQALRCFVKNEIHSILDHFQTPPKSMVATAGTPTTVSALLQNLQIYDAALVHKSIISKHDLDALFLRLKKMPLAERQNIPCLPKGRADVILAGCLILSEVMQAFGFDKTSVSDRGLRHGLLLETLEQNL